MNAQLRPERGFAPEDWNIDVQVPYGTNFAWDLGFDIGFAPWQSDSDDIYDAEDYHAEVVHWSYYIDPPDENTLFRLGRMACALYVEALKARDERLRRLRETPPLPGPTDENRSDEPISGSRAQNRGDHCMTARTGAGANALEFELANGDCIRMTLTRTAVIGELFRDSACLARARFANFTAIGTWMDANIRGTAGMRVAREGCED